MDASWIMNSSGVCGIEGHDVSEVRLLVELVRLDHDEQERHDDVQRDAADDVECRYVGEDVQEGERDEDAPQQGRREGVVALGAKDHDDGRDDHRVGAAEQGDDRGEQQRIERAG